MVRVEDVALFWVYNFFPSGFEMSSSFPHTQVKSVAQPCISTESKAPLHASHTPVWIDRQTLDDSVWLLHHSPHSTPLHHSMTTSRLPASKVLVLLLVGVSSVVLLMYLHLAKEVCTLRNYIETHCEYFIIPINVPPDAPHYSLEVL